jgi:hypothetical protein
VGKPCVVGDFHSEPLDAFRPIEGGSAHQVECTHAERDTLPSKYQVTDQLKKRDYGEIQHDGLTDHGWNQGEVVKLQIFSVGDRPADYAPFKDNVGICEQHPVTGCQLCGPIHGVNLAQPTFRERVDVEDPDSVIAQRHLVNDGARFIG